MSTTKDPVQENNVENKKMNNNNNGIEVICAGLGRTGTMSLMEALKILDYNPYHYVGPTLKDVGQWAKLAQEEEKEEEGEENNNKTKAAIVDDIISTIVTDGYDVVLENPSSDIYLDFVKRYPNAKVILTVRDDGKKFAKSWKTLMNAMVVTETTFTWKFPSFLGYIPMFRDLKHIRHWMGTTHLGLEPGALTHGWRNMPGGDDASDAFLAKQYERHNKHVMEHIPEDQLLVFNVKEGWKPLCDFLDRPIPTGTDGKELPFPHSQVNTSESLKNLRMRFEMVVYGWIPTVVILALGTAIYCFGGKRNMAGKAKLH